MGSKGMPELRMPNQLLLRAPSDAFLKSNANSYWYPHPDLPIPEDAAWIVNLCADADTYQGALKSLDSNSLAKPPIFNHPRAVMATRRDIGSKLLEGIDGLEVPKCHRFMAHDARSFTQCFAQNGFHYPVTVQPTTCQNGYNRVWIAHPADWQDAFKLGKGGQQHFMVQADPADREADWMMRMVFVGRGGTVEPSRLNVAANLLDPAMTASKPIVKAIFQTALTRMPLDDWTMDVLVRATGQCRLIDFCPGLPVPAADDELHQELRGLTIRLSKHLAGRVADHLSKPEKWRCDANSLVSLQRVLEGRKI
jgi:hypothetical protein